MVRWRNMPTPSNYAWQKQETLKGRGAPVGTESGGWGFHTWRVSDPETLMWRTVQFTAAYAAGLAATNAIPNCPVFNRGYAPMFDHGATQDEVFMALAKYVPAISSAVGHTRIVHSDAQVGENHNLDEVGAYHDGWCRDVLGEGIDWRHSDMKDVAYYYVWPLYEEIVNRKGLFK